MLSEMIALEFDDGCAYAQTSAKKQQHDVVRHKKRTEKSKNAKIEEKTQNGDGLGGLSLRLKELSVSQAFDTSSKIIF